MFKFIQTFIIICSPQLQLKVVKPSEFQNDDNSTIGQFTAIQHSGLFLASFTAKLPLNLTGITDIFGELFSVVILNNPT